MTELPHAVFLSYASQDQEAARRICGALRAAGIEVWFDQSELRGGDAWDRSIRKQIKTCALFVPIISTNTHDRTEGYFRLEWKLAVDRCHLMAVTKPSWYLSSSTTRETMMSGYLRSFANCSGYGCRLARRRPSSSHACCICSRRSQVTHRRLRILSSSAGSAVQTHDGFGSDCRYRFPYVRFQGIYPH